MNFRTWQVPTPDEKTVARLASAIGAPGLLARILVARGLDSLSGVNGLNRGGQGKAAALEYAQGDRVSHMKYGEGTVLQIEDSPRATKSSKMALATCPDRLRRINIRTW